MGDIGLPSPPQIKKGGGGATTKTLEEMLSKAVGALEQSILFE